MFSTLKCFLRKFHSVSLCGMLAATVRENDACLKIWARNWLVSKPCDQPDPLRLPSFSRDPGMVGRNQRGNFIRTDFKRSNPVDSAFPPDLSNPCGLHHHLIFSLALLILMFCHTCLWLLPCFSGFQLSFSAINSNLYLTSWTPEFYFQPLTGRPEEPHFSVNQNSSSFLQNLLFSFFIFCLTQWRCHPSTWQKLESNFIFYSPCTIPHWLVTVPSILQRSPVPTWFFPFSLLLL